VISVKPVNKRTQAAKNAMIKDNVLNATKEGLNLMRISSVPSAMMVGIGKEISAYVINRII